MVYLAALQYRLRCSAIWLAGVILTSMPVALALGGSFLADDAKVEPPAATIEVKVRDGLLTLDAWNAPLADILRTIGEKAGFTVIIRGNLGISSTKSFTDVPLDKVIWRLIGNNSWVMIYGPSGGNGRARGPSELHVYARRTQDTGATAAARTTATNDGAVASESWSASLEDAILRDLAQPDRVARLRAIGMLGRLKGEDSIDKLIQVLLEEKNPSIRQHVVSTLSKIGGDRVFQVLWDVSLRDSDVTVREAAKLALARWE